LPDGPDPPSFREDGLAGVDGGDPLLDRLGHAGVGWSGDVEAAVKWPPFFQPSPSGLTRGPDRPLARWSGVEPHGLSLVNRRTGAPRLVLGSSPRMTECGS